jgi:hypothetical protein
LSPPRGGTGVSKTISFFREKKKRFLDSKEKSAWGARHDKVRSSTGAEVLELTEAPESLPLQL